MPRTTTSMYQVFQQIPAERMNLMNSLEVGRKKYVASKSTQIWG